MAACAPESEQADGAQQDAMSLVRQACPLISKGTSALSEALLDPRRGLGYTHNMNVSSESIADFEAAARRPLAQRMRYAFISTQRPGMDAPQNGARAFDTMAEYRQWCEENLPRWLGFHRPK